MKTSPLIAGLVVITCATNAETLDSTNARQPASPPQPLSEDQPAKNAKLEALLKEANLSRGVADVVKLSESGADYSVILAFVQNSTDAQSLRANDILYLHEKGVAPAVIAAMIQRGAAVDTAAKTRSLAVVETQRTVPAQVICTTPTVQVAPPSSVVYVGSAYSRRNYYPYYSSYPHYYYYNYAWNYPSYGYRSRYYYRPYYPAFSYRFGYRSPRFYGHGYYYCR